VKVGGRGGVGVEVEEDAVVKRANVGEDTLPPDRLEGLPEVGVFPARAVGALHGRVIGTYRHRGVLVHEIDRAPRRVRWVLLLEEFGAQSFTHPFLVDIHEREGGHHSHENQEAQCMYYR
jgi:hypothetical protein